MMPLAFCVRSIYLDHNATTPLDPAVLEVMLPFLGPVYGNPSSIHSAGRRARAALDDARARIAELWHCQPGELVFTSSATEANNLAILGTARSLRHKGRHLITSAIEHPSVLAPFRWLADQEGFQLTTLPVDCDGRVSASGLAACLGSETILVSIMAANNELGTIQPISELGRLCRDRGVIFHTDAAQWLGKEPLPSIDEFNADLVSACSHKLYGPKGVGILFVRSPAKPQLLFHGGPQEQERRAGTENLAAIVGLAEALTRFTKPPVFRDEYIRPLLESLRQAVLAIPGVLVRTPTHNSLNNTLAVSVEDCDAISLVAGLDLEGICASSGAACSAGALEPSHVLLAIGVQPQMAQSLLRFSLGRDSTSEDVQAVAATLPLVIQRARALKSSAL